MTTLTDTQSILLSSASQRDDGSLYPLSGTLTAPKPAIAKSIASLVTRGLVEERETADLVSIHRTDGDLSYGVYITAAGMAAIGAAEEMGDPVTAPPVIAAPKRDRTSKSATVIALLERGEGATIPELIAATGWLPHTTRAALTGLRKKGHAIERGKRDDATCYRIAGVA